MPDRVLTVRALNRAVLARQLLLERVALTPARALERVAGLQTQYAPSGYVGLWSRLAGFRAADLTADLLSGAVVQGWVMRATIHMVSARDHAPLAAAVREPRREGWRRAHRALAPADVDIAAEAVRALLADGPRRQVEIQAHLAAAGLPKEVWPGVQLWVDLVRTPPAGTWRTPRAHVYGLAPRSSAAVAAAEELLVRRYLRGFGPAPARDVASFCGWTATAARAVLGRLELRRFRDESGGELLDLPRAPLPAPDVPAPVRFLGPWEAVLLVHARRAQVLPERHRPRVFATSMPQSVPTFLVDGQVAGTWKRVDGQVVTTPFEQLGTGDEEAVRAEAERLSAFHAEADAGR